MSKRGNRKASLAVRLANIQPRGIIPEEKMPGTYAWSKQRDAESCRGQYNAKIARESFFANRSVAEIAEYAYKIPKTNPIRQESKNESIIDNVNQWIDGNGWQYIDGGEYDGSWVNPQYPNRIFSGSSRTLPIRGGVSETVLFPIANNEEDTIGLACHFEVSMAGTKCSILPNKWTNYDSTRKGRLQAKNNASSARRQKRWDAFEEAYKIKDPVKRQEANLALKAQFLSEDILKERTEIGYDDHPN